MPFDDYDENGPTPAPWIAVLLNRQEALWRKIRCTNKPINKQLLMWGMSIMPDVKDAPRDEIDDMYDVL
tara:strand:- start:396 stop:602 length:207 start_codon:yes stop_codon:yes gene_type:complete